MDRQLTGRERKRRRGYMKNLAHMAAHFTTGYQIGFDLDLLPRHGSGVVVFDLIRSTATSDGKPFECQMLGWCRDMVMREIERLELGPNWLKRAMVKLRWIWLGEDYSVMSTGTMESEDTFVSVTIHNTQPPLPSPLRKKPYDLSRPGG
jgi:hypothetical protein